MRKLVCVKHLLLPNDNESAKMTTRNSQQPGKSSEKLPPPLTVSPALYLSFVVFIAAEDERYSTGFSRIC